MREQSFTALPNPMSQPNTVTYQASSSEAVYEVVALKEGGVLRPGIPVLGRRHDSAAEPCGNPETPLRFQAVQSEIISSFKGERTDENPSALRQSESAPGGWMRDRTLE